MTDQVLFQMCSRRRADLIGKHQFYVDQAKLRLITQFAEGDIQAEADREGEKFLDDNQSRFNPEVHDGSEFFEMAGDVRDERYQLLAGMRDNIRLSIVSGFFHEWEKNLRQWLVNEVQHWHHGDVTKAHIWKRNLVGLFDLLESFGWVLRSSAFFQDLDACRLVVNVYKHGDGPSLTELANSYPQFLEDPLGGMCGEIGDGFFSPSYEHLKVTDENLEAFSAAIIEFWREVPESVFDCQITEPPSWLIKAIEKDDNKKEQSK